MATQQSAQPGASAQITVRPAKPEDAHPCGQICYEAFCTINEKHGFPPDFPGPEVAIGVLSTMFSHPGFYCVVAELNGKPVGSNCMDERNPIAGIGPITVDPAVQNQSVGRTLMKAVMDRATEKAFAGVRLVQAAFHNRSLSLYTKLGFDTREPLSVMQGPPIRKKLAGFDVRAARSGDLDMCNHICRSVHGHDRRGELSDAIRDSHAVVVERSGRITGYASAIGFFGHAVTETNLDLQVLIASAPEFLGPGILVPTRNVALLRWCLENGLRIVEPMTLMTVGLYTEPTGAYLPSILF